MFLVKFSCGILFKEIMFKSKVKKNKGDLRNFCQNATVPSFAVYEDSNEREVSKTYNYWGILYISYNFHKSMITGPKHTAEHLLNTICK